MPSIRHRDLSMISAFEEAYGFCTTRIETLESSDQRLIVKVVDETGRSFVLKSRPPWISAPDFEVVLGLQEQAISCGARIPPVVPTVNGRVTWYWDGQEYSLHKWIEGSPLGWNVNHSLALGAAVGTFSKSTTAMNAPEVSIWTFPDGRERWLPDTPDQLRTVCRFIEEGTVPNSTFTAIEEIAELSQRNVNTRRLPTSFIHGDVSPLNAIWRYGQATLIDLDAMRWGFRLFDAVQGVATVAGLDPEPTGPTVRQSWDFARAHAFLIAWSREVRPSAVEIEAFPSFLRLALIRVVIGELDLDDPALPTRSDARSNIQSLLTLLRAPVPTLGSENLL